MISSFFMSKNRLTKDEMKNRVLKLKHQLQVAPQETEVESYVVGGIKQDVTKNTFSGFKL